MANPLELPKFLQKLANKLEHEQIELGAEKFLRRPDKTTVQQKHLNGGMKASAVMLILAGTELENTTLLFEERAFSLRSQPGQYSFPGGKVDSEDQSSRATAIRETNEELGLSLEQWEQLPLNVLGEFSPVLLLFRQISVTPVLAWTPLTAQDFMGQLQPSPAEVESLYAPKIWGTGSLGDPSAWVHAAVGEMKVGLAYEPHTEDIDSPADGTKPFIWGFTAALSLGLLEGHLIPSKELTSRYAEVLSSPVVKQVPQSRLTGDRGTASS